MRLTVLTSNKYVHMLPAFAYCLNKHWRPNPGVVVVRYDVRPPKLPSNFMQYAIGEQAKYTWSGGLMRYLSSCGTDVMLLVLEDYLLCEDVNVEAVADLWERLAEDRNIVKVDLSGDLASRGAFPVGDNLCVATEVTPYTASLQAALWRREALLDVLDATENPWQFEKHATGRIKGRVLGTVEPVLRYVNGVGGEGNNPGTWDRRKFPAALWAELSERGMVW